MVFANRALKSGNIQAWLKKASKQERIEMARQIASTVEKPVDEIFYIDTANLEDMAREERMWIARKIVSTIPHDWGCARC